MKRNCPICGKNDKEKLKDVTLINFDKDEGLFDKQSIVCCNYCGFVFHEGFDTERLNDYYGEYTSGGDIKKMSPDEEILNNNMVDFIEHNLKISKDAHILDVGCSFGWVLDLLNERGFRNVKGIDTDKSVIQKLKMMGYQVEEGSSYSTDKQNLEQQFDVVTLKMVMEHLLNPREAVDNVSKWLKEDGVLIIEVPDCSLYDVTAFFPGYFQTVNIEHINNFSAVSLMNLMRGWRMVACESTSSNDIFPVLRMAFKKDVSIYQKIIKVEDDKNTILKSMAIPNAHGLRFQSNIERLKGKRCVIWGVSAYTRGALLYTELGQMDISFFVDSNKMLQQKTLKGKAIVAPEGVADFDGVIVIVGKASQQAIIENIQRLGYDNEVICLSD